MTASAAPTKNLSNSLGELELNSLILVECSVQRGQSDLEDALTVFSELALDHSVLDSEVSYLISGKYRFGSTQNEEDLAATIQVDFVATYELPEGVVFSDDDFDAFAQSVLLQVTPFQREFLATMTNRMGIPAFYLPLIRISDIEE